MNIVDQILQYSKFPFDELLGNSSALLHDKVTIPVHKLSLDIKDNVKIDNDPNNFTFELLINRISQASNLIIICSKDHGHILEFSLSKLLLSIDIKEYDILIVDDRSSDDSIKNLANKYELSYLRIDNTDNIFNYSVINNIASLYAMIFNKQHIIFYNNDIWPDNQSTLSNIVNKHKIYNSSITGCKLLYPKFLDYERLGKPTHLLGDRLADHYDTVQHGGIVFIAHRKSSIYRDGVVLAPIHNWRFYPKNNDFVNLDTRCFAVTGALQIINTSDFLQLNGFNTMMATAFQDIDICIKATEKNMPIYYVGSETMYHAESITCCHEQTNRGDGIRCDNTMWDALWTNKVSKLIGLKNA